jgi:TPR repeat protein
MRLCTSDIQPTSLANVGHRESEEDQRNDAIQQLSEYFQENKERLVKELCDTFRENLDEDRTNADRGDAVAHWSVANWYASDTCVSDLRKSALWMEKAASLGIVSAIEDTGLNYLRGRGVLPDYVKAYAYLSVYSAVSNEEAFVRVINEYTLPEAASYLDQGRLDEAKEKARDLYMSLPDSLIQTDELSRTLDERWQRDVEAGKYRVR